MRRRRPVDLQSQQHQNVVKWAVGSRRDDLTNCCSPGTLTAPTPSARFTEKSPQKEKEGGSHSEATVSAIISSIRTAEDGLVDDVLNQQASKATIRGRNSHMMAGPPKR